MPETPYFSYAEQTRHYFARPHEGPCRTPIGGPAAWRGRELRDDPSWRRCLSAGQVTEIDRALAHAEGTGRPLEQLRRQDFPLPGLADEIAAWRDEVASGRGFLVVGGLPVELWSQAQAETVFWGLGLHMGRPGAQNPQGDLLGHVTDLGERADDPFVRLYRTAADIAYHCDAADVVGLLCLQTARTGGASRIVSSVSVYDALLAEQPDAVEELFEPFLLDIRNEDRSGELRHLPVPPCRYAEGRLRTFYHSDYFRSVVRHDDVGALPAARQKLMDRYEAIASDPDYYLEMDLAPGEIQWLSNHTVLHARTAYEDPPEPERRRHLLRLWLSLGTGAEAGSGAEATAG